MNRAVFPASTKVGASLLGLAFAGLMMAEIPSPSALTGKVTSQAEGAMEGVIVGAKKVGSPITTWVVSNAQGQYTFPRERLEPGKYAISVRAAADHANPFTHSLFSRPEAKSPVHNIGAIRRKKSGV